MKAERPSRPTLTNVLLGLPATLVWLPICAHYLFVFGIMTGVAVFQGTPPTLGSKPLVIAVLVSALCVGGLLGLAALWSLILFRAKVEAAGELPRSLLWCGLWIGFVTCILALALAVGILWQSGLNLFVHSLFIPVLGPMVIFLRELRCVRSIVDRP